MKGKLKLAAIGAFLVVDLVIVALIVAWVLIDSIAASGIERGASYALAVPAEVQKADVDITGGRFEMAGLRISNPTGFDAPHFLRLDDAGVEVSLGSLTKDVVELPALTLDGIDLHLQRREGRSNYQVILDNLGRFESGQKETSEPAPDGKKFVIREIRIENVSVHADLLPVGGELTTVDLMVPEVRLSNVGSGGEPLSIADLTGVLVKAILQSAIEVGGGVLPADIIGDVQGKLGELEDLSAQGVEMATQIVDDATQAAQQAAQQAADDATRAIDDTVDEVEGAVEDVEDTVKETGDRLRGLIPGGKKDEPKKDGGG
ncbi:MAG: AsmA family protein [Planctomycetota bacterium]